MPGTVVGAGDKLNHKVCLFSPSSRCNMKRKRVNKQVQVNKIISSCAEWYEKLQTGGKNANSWGTVCYWNSSQECLVQ